MKRSFISEVVELTKARLCFLALMMSLLGFLLGTVGPIKWGLLFFTLLGTALVGASSGVFNQLIEKDTDALMHRTQDRPLASGRFPEGRALAMGYASAVLGEIILMVAVNPLTAILGALTLFSYLGIYTPSKKVSPLSTLIGSVPGALPPLMGWTAATGTLGTPGILLFLILVIWQIPHFLAIAWVYREDYSRGGLPVLSVVDSVGAATVKQVILYLVVLIPLTLVPSVWGLTGSVYLWGAFFLGLAYLVSGIFLAVYRTSAYARGLFFTSIIYLPILGFLMIFDKVPKG